VAAGVVDLERITPTAVLSPPVVFLRSALAPAAFTEYFPFSEVTPCCCRPYFKVTQRCSASDWRTASQILEIA
jgi:hypothetical protein